MRILLDPSCNDPNYLQIENAIRSAICQGQLHPQEQLPSIRQLAKQLQVAIITVKRAYDDLEQAGLIETRQGKGCFVCPMDLSDLYQQAGIQLKQEFQTTLDKGLKLGMTVEQIRELFDQACLAVNSGKEE
ncbi:GntR family transcriptional regulator [Holdemania massiliensis]|uniref:GntR family transcriptional regulator n=1 Tax=Holdemania massiliensis TaxID=1468449 RepID=A0A6N7S957_9FIRM|nr:GntR family transcriptional regulator [Holdemania massiliensis]MSA71804.1 GntR family transcriptional regulator [Holdemania massiliensis]MSA90078.1 GntR family transcriptional regulator [Holdemania massiliensis]MSB78884.1 GntR family transcriptional regulator [Holdemania massiliensis]MSC33808.1 GntR family transcriptional regulator [Holdemania massiliensis]MSC40198.1 GntR family transcriptional regulator [Holdemania massiliensis]